MNPYLCEIIVQRDELLAILKEIQSGAEMTIELCQRIDAAIERCEK